MKPKKKTPTPAMDKDLAQPPLIPMSAAELKAAGKKLAQCVRELEDMKTAHAKHQAEMKSDREKIANDISAIASTIRQHGR